jgi:RHS repeat-associated protein
MSGISSKALNFGTPENKKNKFQNQELNDDLGVNYYEFKYRNHDPQIGRFIQLDPLSDEYPYNSTYAFSENRVTSSVELEGLEAHDLYDELGPVRDRRKLESQLGIKYEESRGEKIIKWGVGIGLGIVAAAPLLVEGGGALFGATTRLFWWAAANPETAIGVAYTIAVAASGYEGPDLPGPGDDFGRLGRKVYDKLIGVGIKSDDALGQAARNSYNAIIGTIDGEIKGIKTLEGQAQKAFEIRNSAKDFARGVSGPTLKKAAEDLTKQKYGNTSGPSYTDLYNKYYAEATKSGLKGDAAKNQAYQSIIDASKRPNQEINKQYGVQ